MVERQGISVAVVPIAPRGGADAEVRFDELPMSDAQGRYKIAPKYRAKQAACFVRVTEDAFFAIHLKAEKPEEWLLTKNEKADAVLVEINIDGGSLGQKKMLMKDEMETRKIFKINRFVHAEGAGLEHARARFEQRNDRASDVRFAGPPGKREGEIVVKLTHGRFRPRKAKTNPDLLEPTRDVCKEPTVGLDAAGITLFVAPELGKSKEADAATDFAFSKRMGADELKFTFAYRVSGALVEDVHGGWLSGRLRPSTLSKRATVNEASPPKTPNAGGDEAEQTVTPKRTPIPEMHTMGQRSTAHQQNGSAGASCARVGLPKEDLATPKRSWRCDEDDEEMNPEDFKRRKLERAGASPVSYEINANGQVDLTSTETTQSMNVLTTNANALKEGGVPISLPIRPSPHPRPSPLAEQPQSPKQIQKRIPYDLSDVDLRLMSDKDMELEYLRNRDRLFRAEIEQRRAQSAAEST